mmetsp:Transcript_4760/g.4416  ORF Transcript_4760/g.4416 Transcript_4760/m.4416 type:complete len:203 (-) Transcript_4760:904-1512(-)
MYYEEAALQTISYVEESFGLDVVERKKLSIGTHALQDQMQLFDKSEDKIYSDFIELLDLKSDYGSADSLSILGIQYVYGKKNVKRDFAKARDCFEKALLIDPNHTEANYYLGFIHMHGLGTEVKMNKALGYFQKLTNDSASYNSMGYIYFSAPNLFDIDPVQTNKYGGVHKNTKIAQEFFNKAASLGNVNALYNLGCMNLQL